MMKQALLVIAGIFLMQLANAQNPPSFERPSDSTLLLGSGQHYIVLPYVSDGDEGIVQDISFSVVSSDPMALEVIGLDYTAGQTCAIVRLEEKGLMDTVAIQVEATDADGSFSMDIDVIVAGYDNPGINFEIHDVIFWQELIPLDANPAFSMIAESGLAPYSEIDLAGLDLSVYSDCGGAYCTGTDFFTAFFKGYLVPTVSGDYTFYMKAGDRNCLGLSSDESFDNIDLIIYRGEQKDEVGTSSGSKEWKSETVSLTAGKTYAIYGAHWNIHTLLGGMSWEGPGIEKQYIPGENLSFVYDSEKPTVPGDFTLVTTGIDDFTVRWNPSDDDQGIGGYRLYLDGVPVSDELLDETTYHFTGLQAGTRYCAMVSSVDEAGNESEASSIITTTTYVSDDQAPLPPSSVEASTISDLWMELAWSGASDAETEVRGYRVYVDGVLYNTDELILDEGVLISGLTPETDYAITIEALDAAYNVSALSEEVVFTSSAFDPLDNSISDKKLRMSVLFEPAGRSEGIGVNLDYVDGGFLSDPDHVQLIKDHKSAALRWGALTANPLNFSDYVGSDNQMTIARFMDFCNEVDAYTVFTCGVEDATDWRTDPQTFLNFMEYIAGPAESTYGAMRVAEGFSESLLDASRGLIFEFGNEVWGGSSHSAQIGSDYAAYGAWCREMASLMRSSEYYDSTKIKLVYSGRYPKSSDSYGLHESLLEGDQGEVDWLAVSGYMGGNLNYSPEVDPGESELDYYKNGIAYMSRNLDGLLETADLVLQYTGNFKPSYFYEANMTNSAYYGRLGQAIVQTDYYASAVERGGAIPTVFHLTGGQWKMTVPAQDYLRLPLYHATQFYNRHCIGNVLEKELETTASVTNYVGSTGPLAPVGCHAYAREDGVSILLISRDFENDFMVEVDLPDDLQLLSSGAGMKYIISGEDYSSKTASIDSSSITMSDSLLVEVPRHSMVILSFAADVPDLGNLPMGSFFDYISASDIEIYPYGATDYDIVANGKKILKVNVLPEDAWSDAVIWTVKDNGIEAITSLESYGFVVQGSMICGEDGTIQVRASAWDNPDVYDEVDIPISEQGINCSTGFEQEEGKELKLYPNPASTRLYVSGLPVQSGVVRIMESSGRQLLEEVFSGSEISLDLGQLDKGLYLISIESGDQRYNRTIVIE